VIGTRTADLYPFEQTQWFPPGDEETARISLAKPFIFLQKKYSGITVHSDGYISLQTAHDPLSSQSVLIKNSEPLIGVFICDVETGGLGRVYYERATSNSTLLSAFEQSIHSFFNDQISISELVVVTWSGVRCSNTHADKTSTFQLLLGTDTYDINSYAYFLYHTLECTITDSPSSAFSQVGFSDVNFTYSLLPGTNASESLNFSHYYYDSGGSGGYKLLSEVGSISEHALALRRLSNVAQPGLWAFRVDGPTVQSGEAA
jgi:hypothetical protein